MMPPHRTLKRRTFLAVTAMSAALRGGNALAQGSVDPNDPRAVSLGFTNQHRRVDSQRWPKKAAETPGQVQRCASCALREESGGCQLFAGATVPDDGWCNGWTPR